MVHYYIENGTRHITDIRHISTCHTTHDLSTVLRHLSQGTSLHATQLTISLLSSDTSAFNSWNSGSSVFVRRSVSSNFSQSYEEGHDKDSELSWGEEHAAQEVLGSVSSNSYEEGHQHKLYGMHSELSWEEHAAHINHHQSCM